MDQSRLYANSQYCKTNKEKRRQLLPEMKCLGNKHSPYERRKDDQSPAEYNAHEDGTEKTSCNEENPIILACVYAKYLQKLD